MSTFVLLTITGLGLGAMYFLVASGLSLIYGLMGVLNFAHGAFITFGAYSAWWLSTKTGGRTSCSSSSERHSGCSSALRSRRLSSSSSSGRSIDGRSSRSSSPSGSPSHLGALVYGIWGPDAKFFPVPDWMLDTTTILGASIPNDRFVEIAVAAVVLLGLLGLLRFTRIGLVIQAGVENRAMVTALGDRRAQGIHARLRARRCTALAGVVSGVYYGSIDPQRGHRF